jgi:Sec-independent protein translocase protein TatA
MDPKVWTLLIIVLVVCLVLAGALKLLQGVVADRRTRRIIEEGLGDDEDEKPEGSGGSNERPSADQRPEAGNTKQTGN